MPLIKGKKYPQIGVAVRKSQGKDFYHKMGQLGGRASKLGGFASNNIGKDGLTGPQRASKYGKIGGAKSKRRKL